MSRHGPAPDPPLSAHFVVAVVGWRLDVPSARLHRQPPRRLELHSKSTAGEGCWWILAAIPLLCLAACADPPAATTAPSAHADAAVAGPDVPTLPPDAQPADTAPAVACTTAATCPKPASPCQAASCHPQLGCLAIVLPDGAVCDDGDACTPASACVSGGCLAGVALACSDGNACTIDTCDPTKGCMHAAAADDTPCEDGKACSNGDGCVNGACVAGPSTCQCQKDADCLGYEDGDACNGTLYCA